jgi:hypothetical protein
MIRQFSDWLTKGIVTPKEFGQQAIDAFLHDTACDPAAIFKSVSEAGQAAILDCARRYKEQDYLIEYLCLGTGETPEEVIARQPVLRQLCEKLFNA